MTGGTNPVATYSAPVNTIQNATTYKANIDGGFAVAQRIIDQWAPHQAVAANMTVVIDAGSIYSGTTLTEVAQQASGSITAPSGSNKRIDRAVISSTTGALSIITGTPTTGTPAPPAITSGHLPVAQIGTVSTPLTASTTAITNAMILDERNFWSTATQTPNYYQATPSNPTGTTSSSQVMMGLGGSATITPAGSGLIDFTIYGDVQSNGSPAGIRLQLYFGTGSAPANGAAATGTPVGSNVAYDGASQGSIPFPFCLSALIPNLTPGTTYWLDLAVTSSGYTATVADLSIKALEK